MEYEQVNTNFRMLADIRFKLLALIPTLGGVAVYVLGKIVTDKQVGQPEQVVAFLVSLIGFVATLGILFYDQRNTELYNALIGRARDLEKLLELPAQGQFNQRPDRGRYLLNFRPANYFPMGHDIGLALIYGPVLGAWLFPIAYLAHLALRSLMPLRGNPLLVALAASVIAAAVFTLKLLSLDESLPGQSIKQIGEVRQFDASTGELCLMFESHGMSRIIKGHLTQACIMELGPGISQIETGLPVKVHYKNKLEWDNVSEEWKRRKEIIEVLNLSGTSQDKGSN